MFFLFQTHHMSMWPYITMKWEGIGGHVIAWHVHLFTYWKMDMPGCKDVDIAVKNRQTNANVLWR